MENFLRQKLATTMRDVKTFFLLKWLDAGKKGI
jgi:hypothetical protein